MPSIDFRALLHQEREALRRQRSSSDTPPCGATNGDGVVSKNNGDPTQCSKKDAESIQDRRSKSPLYLEPLGFSSPSKAVDLSEHAVQGGPGGLWYIADFLGEEEACRLLRLTHMDDVLDSHPWVQVRGRKLRCFGGEPSNDFKPEPLPRWLSELGGRLVECGVLSAERGEAPNHVLVNVYQPGEGILPHTDGPFYLNKVVILSLGSPAVFHLRPRHMDTPPQPKGDTSTQPGGCSLVLQPRSLLVFSEPLYSNFLHSIEAQHTEVVPPHVLNAQAAGVKVGDEITRGVRTSLTIRRILGPTPQSS